MLEQHIPKETIQNLLINDPLFEIIQNTANENILYSDEYLELIDEKKYYTTTDLAHWFAISDGQVRYYIRPFHTYIFDGEEEETPSSAKAMRLSLQSILKIRMILLLKEEYKVNGLKRVLGLTPIITRSENNPMSNDKSPVLQVDFDQQVNFIMSLVQQMLETGAFNVENNENKPRITLNANLAHLLDGDSQKLLSNFQEELNRQGNYTTETINSITEKLNDHNKNFKTIMSNQSIVEKVAEENEVIIKEAQLLKEKVVLENEGFIKETQLLKEQVEQLVGKNQQLEQNLYLQRELEDEALDKWRETNKYGFMARIFKADEIELERHKFVTEYIKGQLNNKKD